MDLQWKHICMEVLNIVFAKIVQWSIEYVKVGAKGSGKFSVEW